MFRIHGSKRLAHRVAWAFANGPTPTEMNVLHKCDNPPCCNPNHLFLGTKADNTNDMVAKGRIKRGSQYAHAKLTESDIPKIKELYASGLIMRVIAPMFGVTLSTIHRAVHGTNWKHVASTIATHQGGEVTPAEHADLCRRFHAQEGT